MASLLSSSFGFSTASRVIVLCLISGVIGACGGNDTADDTIVDQTSGGTPGTSGDGDGDGDGPGSGGRATTDGNNLGGELSSGGATTDDELNSGGTDMGGEPGSDPSTGGESSSGGTPSTNGCEPGQYFDRASTRCLGCPSGTFSPGTDSEECEPWTRCAAGTHVSNTPSPTVNRECEPCAQGTYTIGDNASACQVESACPAGTVQTAAGSSTSPPACASCSVGEYCAGGTHPVIDCGVDTWDHDEDPRTACATKTQCLDGQYVEDEGDATSDHICSDCESATFSVGPDADECTAWSECDAGSAVTNTPSTTEDTTCDTCDAGTYCPGGLTLGAACNESSWDDDADASTPCAAKKDCAPGQYVVNAGDPLTNRVCSDCTSGFSTTANAASCTDWTVCLPGKQITAGTATADTVCKPEEWIRQFGTSAEDSVSDIQVDGSGSAVIFGTTAGALPDETNVGLSDVFVRKYDSQGNVMWTTQFGTTAEDYAGAGTVDAQGNIYYAGQTNGVFPGQTKVSGLDVFVTKFDSKGTLIWTRQVGTAGTEQVRSVSVDESGNVYLTGYTDGVLPGETALGLQDTFLIKLSSSSSVLWTKQIGTAGLDYASGVREDGAGNLLVAGYTSGVFPTQTNSAGFWDGYLSKYDSTGTAVWTRQFGASGNTAVYAMTRDAAGNFYLGGRAEGALSGATPVGGEDGFFRKYDGNGNVLLTRQFGTTALDNVYGIHADASGNVVMTGLTSGTFPGQSTIVAPYDGFVLRYNSAGSATFTRQLGSTGNDGLYGVGVDSMGSIYAVGAATGAFPGFTVGGSQDAVITKLVP